jgi:hypothetical protein
MGKLTEVLKEMALTPGAPKSASKQPGSLQSALLRLERSENEGKNIAQKVQSI